MTGAPVRKVRCAIYTRKSTDHNLDIAFNSLDAQREACEQYVQNHKGNGLVLVPDRYDDGDCPGGTMERPAVKRLLRDVEHELIDCILVYKLDRISRSQLDFLQLMKMLKDRGVGFVSVTQPFETATAAGRAMLGSMMVFAQLEREMSAERIRDKIAASRRRGIWMGGVVPFGYIARDKKLCIQETEADVVRSIFNRFIVLGSATKLAQELQRDGTTTRSGKLIDKGFLYKMLNNRVYLGEAVHKQTSYPGEHQAIVESDLWDKVQSILQVSPRQRAARTRAETPALLRGLIFGSYGVAMSPTHTTRRQRQYRYYVSQAVLKKGAGACEVARIPAGQIESLVIDNLRRVIRSPEIVVATWRAARFNVTGLREAQVTDALAQLDPLWDQLFAQERARIVQLLVARVEVGAAKLDLHIRTDGFKALAQQLSAPAFADNAAEPNSVQQSAVVVVSVPLRFRKRGGLKQILAPDGGECVVDRKPDGALIKAVARAFRWRKKLESGVHATLADLASAEKINPSYVSRVLRLTLLAPDVVEAILDGRQSPALPLAKALRPFPTYWVEQIKDFTPHKFLKDQQRA